MILMIPSDDDGAFHVKKMAYHYPIEILSHSRFRIISCKLQTAELGPLVLSNGLVDKLKEIKNAFLIRRDIQE